MVDLRVAIYNRFGPLSKYKERESLEANTKISLSNWNPNKTICSGYFHRLFMTCKTCILVEIVVFLFSIFEFFFEVFL